MCHCRRFLGELLTKKVGILLLLFSVLGTLSHAFPNNNHESKALSDLEQAYASAKKAYLKQPAKVELRRKYLESTLRYAHKVLTSLSLGPRKKYPKALSLYREALRIDPRNLEAKRYRDLIEGIYKGMGRPIPKA